MTVNEVIHYLSKFDPNLKMVINFTDTTDWTDQFVLSPGMFKIGDRNVDGNVDDETINKDELVVGINLQYGVGEEEDGSTFKYVNISS